MPFTLSHPAAVMPLRRCGLVFSALVVGSMAPDFEYFFGLARPISHTLPGIVTFTFPLALAVLVIFHSLVKWPVISLLPRGLQARVIGPARRFRWFPATRFLRILLSLAVGIATHIFWDGFTHDDGWAVVLYGVLRHSVPVFGRHWTAVFLLLQLAGTAVGIVVLALFFAAWYKRASLDAVRLRPQFSPGIKWAFLCGMTALAAGLGLVNGGHWYGQLLRSDSREARFAVGFALTSMAVGSVELFGFSLIWRAYHRMQRERVPASADE